MMNEGGITEHLNMFCHHLTTLSAAFLLMDGNPGNLDFGVTKKSLTLALP